MPRFHYTAVTPSGEMTDGTIDAASEADVVSQLRRRGNIPARIEPAGKGTFLARWSRLGWHGGPALSRRDLADITRELAVMVRADNDVDHALRFLVQTAANNRICAVMQRLRSTVQAGSTLAHALEQQPGSFPQVYVGLIRVGETSGTLPAVLGSLASMLERQRRLISAVQSAMIYPSLLMLTAVGSTILLLTRVLPQFVPMFQRNGVAVPQLTRVLIATGDAISKHGLLALIVASVLVLVLMHLLRRPRLRLVADRAVLSLPVIGWLARESLGAQFARTLGTLLSGGVPLIAAMDVVRSTLGNSAAVAAVERATQNTATGAGLAGPLHATGLFPLRLTHLLQLGEENGRLAEMALQAAEIHEENLRLGLERLVSLLVPVIVIAMGALVALIVSSLVIAMLSLNELVR